jgi:hypothetical protein
MPSGAVSGSGHGITGVADHPGELLRVGAVIAGDEHLEARLGAATDRFQIRFAQNLPQTPQRQTPKHVWRIH